MIVNLLIFIVFMIILIAYIISFFIIITGERNGRKMANTIFEDCKPLPKYNWTNFKNILK